MSRVQPTVGCACRMPVASLGAQSKRQIKLKTKISVMILVWTETRELTARIQPGKLLVFICDNGINW
jgi:hypothetical protein